MLNNINDNNVEIQNTNNDKKPRKQKKKQSNIINIKTIISDQFKVDNYEIEGSPLNAIINNSNNIFISTTNQKNINDFTTNNNTFIKKNENSLLSQQLIVDDNNSGNFNNHIICGNNTFFDQNELTSWHISHHFNYNAKNNNWPKFSKICCWNDSEAFENVPIMIPRDVDIMIEEFRNFEGVFCSVGCALRWLKDQGSTDIPMRIMKFGIFISKVLKLELLDCRVAYPKIMLKKFGGLLTIEQYRQDLKLFAQEINQVDHLFLPAALLFEINRETKENNEEKHAQIYEFEKDIYKNPNDKKIPIFNTPLWILRKNNKNNKIIDKHNMLIDNINNNNDDYNNENLNSLDDLIYTDV